jgi:glucosyl-dolichyl phosphate glucuronosyltransferase
VASNPLLSIVVTSYTTERMPDLFELLDSIKVQTCSDIETVFVAERSHELLNGVHSYAEKISLNIKAIFNKGEGGLSASRNLGIANSAGDIIAFVDDDVVIWPGWAEVVIKTFEDTSIIGVTGPALPLWQEQSLSWLPEEFYWLTSCTGWGNFDGMKEVRNAWGMNMSFRRELFASGEIFRVNFGLHNGSRSRWYDPPSEDVDLSMRARQKTKKRIVYVPEAGVNHRVARSRLSTRFVSQRSFSIGYQRRMLKKLYPVNDNGQLLAQENTLLKQIILHLLPSIVSQILTHPIVAWNKFRVTCTSLIFVAIGYAFAPLLKTYQ